MILQSGSAQVMNLNLGARSLRPPPVLTPCSMGTPFRAPTAEQRAAPPRAALFSLHHCPPSTAELCTTPPGPSALLCPREGPCSAPPPTTGPAPACDLGWIISGTTRGRSALQLDTRTLHKREPKGRTSCLQTWPWALASLSLSLALGWGDNSG